MRREWFLRLLHTGAAQARCPPPLRPQLEEECIQPHRVVEALELYKKHEPPTAEEREEHARTAVRRVVENARGELLWPFAHAAAGQVVFAHARFQLLNPIEVADKGLTEFLHKLDGDRVTFDGDNEECLRRILFDYCHKAALELLRENRKYRHLQLGVREAASAADDPSVQLASKERLEKILHHCDELDQQIVEKLLLGNSFQQVADDLGITRDALSQRSYRLRRRMESDRSIDVSETLVHRLSPRERHVLTLRKDGYTFDEIASIISLRDKQQANAIARTAIKKITDALTLAYGSETGHDRQEGYREPSHQEDLLLSPEQKEALFARLPRSRQAVASLLSDVAKESVSHLKSPESKTEPQKDQESPLLKAVAASLPEEYAARLQVLDDASRVSRNELVTRVLDAVSVYLAMHEPEENQQIKDHIKRREDLVRQKRELAEEVSRVFEKLGLTLCCPSGKPGSLKVIVAESNPKGVFRLIPRGTGQQEAARARLRDLLPSFRFEGADAHLEEPSRRPAPSRSQQQTGPNR